MTDIIATDLQQLEVDSRYIELFELIIDSTNILYFHPGVEEDLTTIQFRDRESPYTLRTYSAMPILMEGLELKADGATSRPTLTLANILDKFSSLSGDYGNDDLVGKTLVRRRTLKKHLHGEREAGAAGTAPTEFPIIKYIIDRVANEDAATVTFEVTVPYDLENIKIPRRVVTGKYCSWEYQGAASGRGGCTWPANSKLNILKEDGSVAYDHNAFFNHDDKPFIFNSFATSISAWATGQSYTQITYVSDGGKYWQSQQTHTSAAANKPTGANRSFWVEALPMTTHDSTDADYAVGAHVLHSDKVWRCLIAHNSSTSTVGTILPQDESAYWVRADLCSKTLRGCKCRFQFNPRSETGANAAPSSEKRRSLPLPFGGFPGTLKF